MKLIYKNTLVEKVRDVPQAASSSQRGTLLCFLLAILLPISFEVAGLRLTPLKLLLLAAFVPLFLRLGAGRFCKTDILIFLYVAWIFLALIVSHGLARVPYAGITAVEVLGGYLFGRTAIRNSADYRWLIRALTVVLLGLLPFAITELITGRIIIFDLFRPLFDTPFRGASAYGRMGFERVYGVFDHPILFGLFCSFVFANAWFALGGSRVFRLLVMGLALIMTGMALSSAPLLAIALQLTLIFWALATRGAWKTLLFLSAVGYVLLDLASNRTPITIIIDLMTFNPMSGWIRLAIFDYGMLSVMSHPIFGIGLNDWPRPDWLTASVDNFWLLNAMRYGIPATGFFCLAIALHAAAIVRAPLKTVQAQSCRIGYLIVLASLVLVLVTVHIWGAVGVFTMFYIGAGSWFYTGAVHAETKDTSTLKMDANRTEQRYTRFGPPGRTAQDGIEGIAPMSRRFDTEAEGRKPG